MGVSAPFVINFVEAARDKSGKKYSVGSYLFYTLHQSSWKILKIQRLDTAIKVSYSSSI